MGHRHEYFPTADELVDEAFPPEVEARAVVEGRFLSMRGRMLRMGIPRPTAVLATGGGTNSPAMMQVPIVFRAGIESLVCRTRVFCGRSGTASRSSPTGIHAEPDVR